jgi:NADPH2:quinone reductase
MRVILAAGPGGPEVLQLAELPTAQPGPGQVLVAVECAAVTFVDTQMRAGTTPGPRVDFPVVLGNGVGGTVASVADDVDPAWVGARVVTSTGGTGGYASRAVAARTDLHRLPDSVATWDATAVLADGRTAVGLHRAAQVRAGDIVVVTAAAGGVGSLLVQLAAADGATVVALASTDEKLALARSIGAEHEVNYTGLGWEELLRELAPAGVDVTFDGVGGEVTERLYPQARPGSRYLTHGASGGRWADIDAEDARAREVSIIPLSAVARGPDDLFELVEEALRLTGSGTLRPVIGQTFSLEQAAEAHAAIEARATTGKTLLIP